jgi:hypothetical protein
MNVLSIEPVFEPLRRRIFCHIFRQHTLYRHKETYHILLRSSVVSHECAFHPTWVRTPMSPNFFATFSVKVSWWFLYAGPNASGTHMWDHVLVGPTCGTMRLWGPHVGPSAGGVHVDV